MADLSETRLIGQLDGKHVGERTLVGLDVSDEEPGGRGETAVEGRKVEGGADPGKRIF